MQTGLSRKTYEPELPAFLDSRQQGYYRFPSHRVDGNAIVGREAIIEHLVQSGSGWYCIDGFAGVDWDSWLADASTHGASVFDARELFPDVESFRELIEPYLGAADPVFGRRCPLSLLDLLDHPKVDALRARIAGDDPTSVCIVIGAGSYLAAERWTSVMYIDCPKNELQFRARAGAHTNLGPVRWDSPKRSYKQSYFVDWPVLNRHKQEIFPHLDVFVDDQRSEISIGVTGGDFRNAINSVLQRPIRARPWFEPGAWGGNWMHNNLTGLNGDAPNYAWSFELIAPENGIVLEFSGYLLECSFDYVLFSDARAMLGERGDVFGTEFPIRFDFLDTVEGGNLSIQCHPQPEYIIRQFGESFTQTESYYILHAEPDSRVYLGLQPSVDIKAFETALRESTAHTTPLQVKDYVVDHASHQGDLFLIPPGTVHSAGSGNVVLEISATPYIFTFKLYDWLRLDLDGNPRPLNIDRGMENIEAAGDSSRSSLQSSPDVLSQSDAVLVEELPTTERHFYQVHRYTIHRSVTIELDESVLVGMVVQGTSVQITCAQQTFEYRFAETFVIPAELSQITFSAGRETVTVVTASLKPELAHTQGRGW